MREKYQLRYAAGTYWLIDMDQTGIQYKKPIPMNESGAFIWKAVLAGGEGEQIIREFCDRFSVDRAEAGRDVDAFLSQLSLLGILP
jgi:hypothetical protein